MNNNFRWLAYDIDNSLVLKVLYNDEDYAVFNVLDVLEVTGDKLDIETANVDDLTNLFTVGMVRFYNVDDPQDIIDVPLRNLYKLYYEDDTLLEQMDKKTLTFKDLDVFSIIDGTITNECLIVSSVVREPTDDLVKVMKIAYNFGKADMQEKFDYMIEATFINHRRLKDNEDLSKKLR